MIHGMDTGFLVASEMREHADFAAACHKLTLLVTVGDSIAIAPDVLSEFLHVVTDPRRFQQPLDMDSARDIAEQFWNATDAVKVFPDENAVRLFLSWHRQFSLGRKRLIDTLLAATYSQAGISSILTTNPADFAVFGVFTCITPTSP